MQKVDLIPAGKCGFGEKFKQFMLRQASAAAQNVTEMISKYALGMTAGEKRDYRYANEETREKMVLPFDEDHTLYNAQIEMLKGLFALSDFRVDRLRSNVEHFITDLEDHKEKNQ